MKRYLLIGMAILAALVWVQTARLRSVKADRSRLSQNQIALMSDVVRYRNAAGDSTVSAQVLRLKCAEFEELRAADAEYIRGMGVKIRRLESASKTATATIVELRAALRDTVVMRPAGAGKSLHASIPDPGVPIPDPSTGVIPDNGSAAARRDPADGSAAARRDPADGSTTARRDPPAALIPDTLRTFLWRDEWVTVSGLIDRDSVSCRIASIDTLRQIIHRVPRRFLFIRWGTKSIRQQITSSNPHTRIVYAEAVQFEK